jgi:adenylate cyclase
MLRYNVGCAYAMELDDPERALDLIEETLRHLGVDHIRHVNADPDLDSLRNHPRFTQMIADSKARHKAEGPSEQVNSSQEKMAPRA